MSKIIRYRVLLIFLCLLGWNPGSSQQSHLELERANSLYFLENPTESQDLEAIALYEKFLSEVPDKSDALAFVQASERLGNLYLAYGQVKEAKKSYGQGILMARAFQLGDTTVYAHHLYLGETYFSLNQLDSSLVHLQAAESLQSKISQNAEPERLYNALGVYFYETGNFNQSVSYFSKAESFLNGDNPDLERYARFTFSSNKASALYRIEEYDQAQKIYRELLKLGINTDQLRINLANTYLEQQKSTEALAVLDSIELGYAAGSLSFHNLRSKVFIQQGDVNQLENQLSLAQQLVSADSASGKNLQKGIFFMLMAELELMKDNPESALNFFQSAIGRLHPDFENQDPFSNPEQITLGMGALTLFDALTKKAQTAWVIYDKKPESTWFRLGMDTWEKAFSLARFISLNYDNEEARVFLGDKVQLAYQEAIDGLVSYSSLMEENQLMQKAFVWAEESKSEGLKIGAMEEAKKRSLGLPGDLIREEKNILFSISRNYQKQLDNRDEQSRAQLEKELVDLKVNLSRLREKFRSYPGFIAEEEQVFSLDNLQEQLPEKYGVLSLFNSRENLLLYWIERDEFLWKVIPKSGIEWDELDKWMGAIQFPQASNRYQKSPGISVFSNQLLSPFLQQLDGVEELMLIPHGFFNSFPFELLPFKAEGMLLEEKAISYQFSSRFITTVSKSTQPSSILSFAPFARIAGEHARGFSVLPGSETEIQQLGGQKYFGKEGDREVFLEQAPKAKIIHLATHAVASSKDPNEAFIAFYPEEEEFRLFAPELAFQNLEAVELVYLSACETGSGKLSSSEGLISLARSFAIAGADQLVISQWVSEDQVSGYLSSRFYHHAGEGNSYSNSLRLAKMDLLSDPQMAQFHHPFYWTNYRIIGQPEAGSGINPVFISILAIVILAIAGSWLAYRFDPRRKQALH